MKRRSPRRPWKYWGMTVGLLLLLPVELPVLGGGALPSAVAQSDSNAEADQQCRG